MARARAELGRGEALAEVTYRFQRRVEEIARQVVEDDVAGVSADSRLSSSWRRKQDESRLAWP